MEMSNEDLLSSLQQMIDAAEKRMAEMCGMQLKPFPIAAGAVIASTHNSELD